MSEIPPITRWRLILGEAADNNLGCCTGDAAAMDAALAWLYGRDRSLAERDVRDHTGGRGRSNLSVPDWIQEVHRLFPKETIERLEQDAVERYAIDEVVTNPAVLARVEPNQVLLKAVLRTRHLMRRDVLDIARKLVAEVVRRLMEKLTVELRVAFAGTLDRRRRTTLATARNLDFHTTLRKNLKHWSVSQRKLYIEKAHFFARTRRHSERWQLILLVDQSSSMAGSVIHAAVTAACLWGLPGIQTHLALFSTDVVDVTPDVTDPVELLLKVQLGGGTDIQRAVAYASEQIDQPRRAIVVLITDFMEGGPTGLLERRVKGLVEQGTRVLGLAALDEDANPAYDRALAARLVALGAEVAAMTPGELASWIADRVRS